MTKRSRFKLSITTVDRFSTFYRIAVKSATGWGVKDEEFGWGDFNSYLEVGFKISEKLSSTLVHMSNILHILTCLVKSSLPRKFYLNERFRQNVMNEQKIKGVKISLEI